MESIEFINRYESYLDEISHGELKRKAQWASISMTGNSCFFCAHSCVMNILT